MSQHQAFDSRLSIPSPIKTFYVQISKQSMKNRFSSQNKVKSDKEDSSPIVLRFSEDQHIRFSEFHQLVVSPHCDDGVRKSRRSRIEKVG